jgi:SWI/SNF-related matrix-associated actin-dependent regulator 1 of chromatin subfamily A
LLITSRYESTCSVCRRAIAVGDRIWWQDKKASHAACSEGGRIVAAKVEASRSVREHGASLLLPVPPGLEYLPFQKPAIALLLEYLAKGRGALLADEMGLGKTVEAIAVVSANTSLRSVLVVCRASLRTNWRREFERWCTRCPSAFGEGVEIEDTLTVTEHDPASAFHPDVTIVSYNQLSTLPNETKWDLLIVDEAHYIKNPQSQRSKDLFTVADRCDKRLLLTGTPIPNTPVELWPLLQLCAPQVWDPPGLLYTKLPDGRREAVPVGAGKGAGFFDFAKKYCGARKEWVSKTQEVWKFDGSSNAAELQEKLRTTCMVRRLKKDVLKDLPPKTRSIVVLPRHAWMHTALGAEIERAETLEEALDLLSGESVAFTEYSKERHAIGLAKVDIAVSHIQAALEPHDKKVVVFCHHNDVADALYGKLEHYNPALVTGLIEPTVRQREVDAFQGDRTCRLLIGTFGAAGEGYTLTASSHVVVVEEPLRPSDMLQAEDRCHRIGQTLPLLCEHLVFDDSIDALIAKLLVDKLTVAEAAFDKEAHYEGEDRPFLERNVSYDRAREEAYASAGIAQAECEALLAKLKALAKIPGGVFNRFDRKIGGSLAAQRFLSPKQGLLARRLVDKYGNKLEGSSS